MTTELFFQWKKKKMEETGLAAQQEKRAKNDHMSDQALFLSDSCLFVDDTKAYEKYQREVESEVAEQKRKGEKIDTYSDKRDKEETMENGDQETLEKTEYNQNKPTEYNCY
ncbi:hypothetical protein FEM48_Zijuj03G0026100 [Ziziphus jujuba var. spinosa]|uniref:ZC3H15/TMA46 family C-terminal domain-containing protein n=1 Tax=Ziziphus jujuba var. spinosa TaxID=714518 RepID=A0A978VMN7_ZIZJJ|nr:hypothetical protein FEM48_Zijuj03G0026100 [Ziziphus jujuba var. spinosa]